MSTPSYNLLIIEAPGKVKKLQYYLKNESTLVLATGGHFKQLARKGIYYSGIDNDFNLHFDLKPVTKGIDFPTRLAFTLKNYNIQNIYLATDPDREGESISWHIYQHIPENLKPITKRITFSEISYDAVIKAIAQARDIDQNLVDSQFARQGYDVLFGFMSSSLVKKHGMISNGRIQGVANKLIYDKQQEIKNFIPNNKYKIKSTIFDDSKNQLELKHVDEHLKPLVFDEESQVPSVDNKFMYVESITSDIKYKYPDKPYVMSTLLTQASKALKATPKTVESALQTLYQSGYITYHRTDNPNISDDFFNSLNKYLKSQNLNPINKKRTFEFNGQGAHEAIRVTKLDVKTLSDITANEFYQKLYTLIRLNTLSQGIKPDSFNTIIERFTNNEQNFIYSWNKIIDSPMEQLLKSEFDLQTKKSITPSLHLNQIYKGKVETKFEAINQKPSQYNESTLIKELESRNIGRPSTFASFGSIIQERNYAMLQNGKFENTELGIKFEELNQKIFPDFVNYDFTKNFESELDDISQGKLNYKEFLSRKYQMISDVIKKHGGDGTIRNNSTTNNNTANKSTKFCDVCRAYKIQGVAKNGNIFYKCANSNFKLNQGCPYEWEQSKKYGKQQ